jgi:hypothetical protein
MPLEAKRAPRKCVRASDWRRAQLTPFSVLLVVCLRSTSQLIVILFLILFCFQFLLFILILSFFIANSIPMQILVLLVVILYPFHILEGFVMSPPTTPKKAAVKRMCQLSPAQQRTLVKQIDKFLFLLSMRDCGLAENSLSLSSKSKPTSIP